MSAREVLDDVLLYYYTRALRCLGSIIYIYFTMTGRALRQTRLYATCF